MYVPRKILLETGGRSYGVNPDDTAHPDDKVRPTMSEYKFKGTPLTAIFLLAVAGNLTETVISSAVIVVANIPQRLFLASPSSIIVQKSHLFAAIGAIHKPA